MTQFNGYSTTNANPNVRFTIELDPRWLQGYGTLWSAAGSYLSPTYAAALNLTSQKYKFIDWAEGITRQEEPVYDQTTALGREESFVTFAGGSNTTYDFTFEFHGYKAPAGGSATTEDTPEWCAAQARWLDRLKHAIRDPVTLITYPPPPVIVTIGNLLRVRAVMTSGSPQFMMPLELTTGLPRRIIYSATFTSAKYHPSDTTLGGTVGGNGPFFYDETALR